FVKRIGTIPAVCGMLAGLGFTMFYILACVYGGMERWTFGAFEAGVDPQGVGTLGMLLNFAVTLALTPLFPPPDAQTMALIDSVREPEGGGPAVEIETAAEH